MMLGKAYKPEVHSPNGMHARKMTAPSTCVAPKRLAALGVMEPRGMGLLRVRSTWASKGASIKSFHV